MEIIKISINWLIGKQIWYIHAVEYYLALKSTEVLI